MVASGGCRCLPFTVQAVMKIGKGAAQTGNGGCLPVKYTLLFLKYVWFSGKLTLFSFTTPVIHCCRPKHLQGGFKYCVLLFDQFHTKLSLTSHLENTHFFLTTIGCHWPASMGLDNQFHSDSSNQLQLEYFFFFLVVGSCQKVNDRPLGLCVS